jgi:hypothetical protein
MDGLQCDILSYHRFISEAPKMRFYKFGMVANMKFSVREIMFLFSLGLPFSIVQINGWQIP